MTIRSSMTAFGRKPQAHPQARYLGTSPTPVAPPADACSVTAWYDDPPLDPKTNKPTGGMATSTMAYLVMGVPAVVGAALGALLWKTHRVGGGAIGAVVGFGAGVGVTSYEYMQWKAAGGSKHIKGTCDGAAGAAPTASAEAPPPSAEGGAEG